MKYAIRIKHYIDGYERIIPPSDYDMWCRVEQELGRPVFEVIGFIVNNQYINVRQDEKDNYKFCPYCGHEFRKEK